MRRSLVAGNWKMNGTLASITELVEELLAAEAGKGCEALICPPSVYLDFVGNLLKGSPLKLGAQHVNWHTDGAFTGEISPGMLRDMVCNYCIVGHSERRALFGETDEEVAEKVAALLNAGITPIVCVGESLAERKAGQTSTVVSRQLGAVLSHMEQAQVTWGGDMVVAYEPVWAIGTGETASPDQAEEVHGWLRQQLMGSVDEAAAMNTRLLYGGSVKADNAAALFACENIDGALVGGASLKADEFVKICQAAT